MPREQANMLSLLKTYSLFFITAIIVLLLTGVAVWDVYLITDSYLHDNRVTLVTWIPIEDNFPYLNYSKLEVCLTPIGSRDLEIFPQAYHAAKTPFRYPDQKDFPQYITNLSKNLGEISSRTIDAGKRRFSISDRSTIFQSLHMVQQMDYDLIDNFYCFQRSDNASCTNFFANYSLMDVFLDENQDLDALESSMWNILEPKFFYPYDDQPNMTRLMRLLQNSVCLDLDLFKALSTKQNWNTFYFNNMNEVETKILNSTKTLNDDWQIRLDLVNHEYKEDFNVPIFDTLQLTVTIYSAGILDRSGTTKNCVDREFVRFDQTPPNDASLDQCRIEAMFRTVVESCRCVPFSRRRYFAKMDRSFADLPSCTSSKYESCWQRIEDEARRLFSTKSECEPLCHSVKNQYLVQQTTIQNRCSPDGDFYSSVIEGSRCQTIELTIATSDQLYAQYTEKPQLTPTQYVGQIGGDIGLYTGLSIFGVWQFVAMVYGIYREHRKQEENRTVNFFETALREIGLSAAASRTQTIVSECSLRQPTSSTVGEDRRWSRMEARMTNVETTMDEMKTMLKRLCEEREERV